MFSITGHDNTLTYKYLRSYVSGMHVRVHSSLFGRKLGFFLVLDLSESANFISLTLGLLPYADYDALRALDGDNPPGVAGMSDTDISRLPVRMYKGSVQKPAADQSQPR